VGTPLRVLLVEDNPDDAAMIELTLARSGYEPSVLRVESALAMSDALDREPWDLILSDFNMPAFDAPAALALLQAHALDIPFIIVSGTVGEIAAVRAMKSGASDYLNKGNLKRLAPAIARELQEAKQRAEHRRAQEELRESGIRFRALIEGLAGRVVADTAEIERFLAELLGQLETHPARAAALKVRDIVSELRAFARTGVT
jgi:DNA-binding NtrC family response regulator